ERASPRLAARRLDLDDVGAEPREHLGATRARLVLREVEDDDPVERLAHVASIVAGAASPARTVGGLPQVRRGPPARLAPWVACLRCAGGRQPGSHRGWPASGAPGAASPARTVGGLPQVRRGPPARLAPWVACLRCAGGRQPGSHRGWPDPGTPRLRAACRLSLRRLGYVVYAEKR